MTTKEILDNLEGKLSKHWIKQKELKNTKDNINQYFSIFSDLRYFVDRTSGNFLYLYNENGEYKDLDYNNIYTQNPELLIKVNGVVDNNKTKEYVDELFKKTDKAFNKLKLIDDLKNDSRLHTKFGTQGRLLNSLPSNKTISLKNLKTTEHIYGILMPYIDNALVLMKGINKKQAQAIIDDKNNVNSINSFLTVCRNIYKKSGDEKFNQQAYLDEKLVNIISALDNIDKIECSEPLMKNRSTEDFVQFLSPNKNFANNLLGIEQLIDEKTFNEHATEDMKYYLGTQKKKYNLN
jgi:hypothetical protein